MKTKNYEKGKGEESAAILWRRPPESQRQKRERKVLHSSSITDRASNEKATT